MSIHRLAETIAARDNRSSGTTSSDAPQARSAILAVPVQDAGRLLLAAHSGKLFLALRNPGDTGLADEALFAPPAPVLALRRDLDGAAEAATRPENLAYAGIDLNALAGDNNARMPAAATNTTAPPRRRGAPEGGYRHLGRRDRRSLRGWPAVARCRPAPA